MKEWTKLTPELIEYILELCPNQSFLEVFAGNGKLTTALKNKGAKAHATSIPLENYDGFKPVYEEHIEVIDAVSAAKKYRDDFDVLIAAWPIADDSMLHCALAWGKPIIFIGELWHEHPANTDKAYSGTASDSYFKNVIDLSEPNREVSPGSAVVLHKLKEKLSPDFTPYLNVYEWSNKTDLLNLYLAHNK